MKRIAVAWLAALATLVVHDVAIAQNAPAPAAGARIISFKETIRIALEQNTTVRAAENSAALGEVSVSEASGQFMPNLTLSSTGSKNFGHSSEAVGGLVLDQ